MAGKDLQAVAVKSKSFLNNNDKKYKKRFLVFTENLVVAIDKLNFI
jgi:hypothetical protein